MQLPGSRSGRDVEIRWVTGFPNNLLYQKIRNTYYGIVQVNNILKVASPTGGYRYSAYGEPQVIVRWHDGYTGRRVYAEPMTFSWIRRATRLCLPVSGWTCFARPVLLSATA